MTFGSLSSKPVQNFWKPNEMILLLIDVQQGFRNTDYWGVERNNPNAEQVCGNLLTHWREVQLPIIHVRHSSNEPESVLHMNHPGFAFQSMVQPIGDEGIITKSVNNAFIGTDLREVIAHHGSNQLIMAGLTTDHCVSTTVRTAGNMGYDTYVVSDATATFARYGHNGQFYDAETVHQISLGSLMNEFATIVDATTIQELSKPIPGRTPN